jgi:hypothetical protein
MLMTGWTILVCLSALGAFALAGFTAGCLWQKRETEHLITLQEITEIQDGLREDIEALQHAQARTGTITGEGEW